MGVTDNHKRCSICKSEKHVDDYYPDKNKKYGVSHRCKLCSKQLARNLYQKYKEKRQAEGRDYMRKRRETNSSDIKEVHKRYSARNPWYARAKAERRRAKKLKATPKWVNEKYVTLWYQLAVIEEKRTGKKCHVDHIVPLQSEMVCGLHCENNMQILFAEDNFRKGNSH